MVGFLVGHVIYNEVQCQACVHLLALVGAEFLFDVIKSHL